MRKIKWGIIGLGKIANKFAADLKSSEDSILQGVASRNLDRAQDFGKKYNASSYYGSYRELAKDPEIDVVYIATPHAYHYENTIECLRNGKGVLCEKPMGLNTAEVAEMIEEAKARNLFFMEAIWTRFIPATEKLVELLEQKVIGDVLSVRADFGFKADVNYEGRIYNKKLGGGSLLDIGIYPIYLSILTLGIPTEIKAMARMTETGVDSYCSMLFHYQNDSKAILESTIEANTPTEAFIYGSKGSIKLHSRFHHPTRITISVDDKEEELTIPYEGNGYLHEITEVNHCIQQGLSQSSKVPLSLSLGLVNVMDKVKDEIGLMY